MWFEVLPSIGVIFVMMTIGGAAHQAVPLLLFGKRTMRKIDFAYQQNEWMRDCRITGHQMKIQGLEGIPDEVPQKK